VTFGFCAIGMFLYCLPSWSSLQVLVAKSVAGVLTLGGLPIWQGDNYFMIDGALIMISKRCTYIGLILMVLPFVWRGDHPIADGLRTLLFVSAVFVINVARICFTAILYINRVPWKYSHDLVSPLIYGPVVILTVSLWLKSARKCMTGKIETTSYHSKKETSLPGSR